MRLVAKRSVLSIDANSQTSASRSESRYLAIYRLGPKPDVAPSGQAECRRSGCWQECLFLGVSSNAKLAGATIRYQPSKVLTLPEQHPSLRASRRPPLPAPLNEKVQRRFHFALNSFFLAAKPEAMTERSELTTIGIRGGSEAEALSNTLMLPPLDTVPAGGAQMIRHSIFKPRQYQPAAPPMRTRIVMAKFSKRNAN